MLTATLRIQDVEQAARRIHPYVLRTPVIWSHATSRYFDAPVCFKCEHLQRTGSFTARGACNAVASLLEPPVQAGVVTHSPGNRAAGVAYAASRCGIAANVLVPWTTAPKKLEMIRRYAPEVEFCEPTMAACEAEALRIASESSLVMIRPCDDLDVIAGDATATAELLAATPQLDLLVVPIGGGGLLAGSLVVAKTVSPHTQVWAAEPAMADDAYRGWKEGRLVPSTHPPTMADELRGQVGPFAFTTLSDLVDDIVCVSEEEIRAALAFLWFEAGMPVEPSSAVALAALMKRREEIRGKRVGIVLTGGNIDPAEARALCGRPA